MERGVLLVTKRLCFSRAPRRASAQSSLQRSVTRKSSSQRESSRAALGETTLGETTLGRTTCPLCAKRMSSALEEEAQERKRR